jgi:hypothetical protein
MFRRRFLFWIGFGLFSLAEQLRVCALDELATALTEGVKDTKKSPEPGKPEHWTVASNRTWRWYERQNLIEGQWKLTGITTPIHKKTGKPFTGRSGYLDISLVPKELRVSEAKDEAESDLTGSQELPPGQPDQARSARHGRPPSKWLRSLYAEELRIWLKTIDVPEAGVSGMTYWEHLTEGHSFDPKKIEGLTIPEQATLHAAAHFGY